MAQAEHREYFPGLRGADSVPGVHFRDAGWRLVQAQRSLGRTAGLCLGGKKLFVLAKPAGQGSGLCQATALVSSCGYIPAASPGFAAFSAGSSLLQGMARAGNVFFLPSLDL